MIKEVIERSKVDNRVLKSSVYRVYKNLKNKVYSAEEIIKDIEDLILLTNCHQNLKNGMFESIFKYQENIKDVIIEILIDNNAFETLKIALLARYDSGFLSDKLINKYSDLLDLDNYEKY